jgi:hypothetical protein
MTVLELEAKKAELVRSILNNVNSEEILNELSKIVNKLTVKKPCMYSPEEIQAGADRVLAARRSGDKSHFIPFGEVKKKHLS